MESIKDAAIVNMIERISNHYRTNISNRFIRPALLQSSLGKETWDQLDALTENPEQFRYQGFQLDELYRQIAAALKFVSATRQEIAPSLRHRLSKSSSSDKVLQNLAVNNFAFNLRLFADLLYDLYVKCTQIDTETSKGECPIYKQMPELDDIGKLVVGM